MQICVMAADRRSSHGHLPLRALTRIEQETRAIPTQKKAVVMAVACWNLAGSSKDEQFASSQAELPGRFKL
jgi:hypothetical protein